MIFERGIVRNIIFGSSRSRCKLCPAELSAKKTNRLPGAPGAVLRLKLVVKKADAAVKNREKRRGGIPCLNEFFEKRTGDRTARRYRRNFLSREKLRSVAGSRRSAGSMEPKRVSTLLGRVKASKLVFPW